MVTTRSKTSRLATETVEAETTNDNSVLLNKSVNSRSKKSKTGSDNYAPTIIFLSLLLDLVAFTVILPLFPSILQYYKTNDGPNGLYHYLENKIECFRRFVGVPNEVSNDVLFGGFLGSLFSFLQFLASPIIGAISDVYGRKPVIIVCLVGLAASYWMWSISFTFATFVVARIIGGISKGNLSLSMAAMTDVSSSDKRASGMALVGAAFSIGFVIGPLIGAYFAGANILSNLTISWFAKPAFFALSLTMADLLFVIAVFKETLPKEKRLKSVASSLRQATAYINVKDLFMFTAMRNVSVKDLKELRVLGFIYFVYLFLYSGLEFTLTFLTDSKFEYTRMEQGYMLSGIGIMMALLQGTWIRKIPSESIQNYACWGLLLIVPSFLCIGVAHSRTVLNIGIAIYAISTSLVIPCMTTMASKHGSSSQKGTVLGIFRSLGYLARAVGPIVASIAYWIAGPLLTYCAGGILLLVPWYCLRFSRAMKV